MSENNQKKAKNPLLVLFIIALIIGGGYLAYKNLVINTSDDGGSIIESKNLTRSDFTLSLENGGWSSVYAIVTPNRDIESIVLKVEYYDSNKKIIKTETKTFYDLDARREYKLEFKNTFMEALKMSSYSISMVSGKRA